MTMKLPNLLNEIAGAVGLEAAIGLARAKGGQRVYMPCEATLRRANASHWLIDAVGLEHACAITRLFPMGMNIVVPLGDRALKRRAAMEMISQNKSSNQIVAATGVSSRAIHRWRAELRKKETQA